MRYQPLVIVLAAVSAGIAGDRELNSSMPGWLAAGAIAWLVWLALWKCQYERAASVVLLVMLISVGGAWHHWRWHYFGDNEIGRFAREAPAPVCVEAIAAAGPRRIPPPPDDPMRPPEPNNRTRLAVEVTRIRVGDRWQPASGNALVLVEGDVLGVHAGDRLLIFGRIFSASPPSNPGEQDLTELARGRRQMAVIRSSYPQSVSVIAPAAGWGVGRWIEDLRTRGHELLRLYLSPENAALGEAVLLGSRDELEPQRIESFVETGTIHIVVVAGLHVGILAYVLFKALRTGWIARRPALVGVFLVTLVYALVTDAEPPVLRATAVVWIVCGSLWLGRGGLGMNSLALAGLCVLALNPTELFRAGTQLSFLSVAGVIAFERFWNRRPSPDPLQRLIAQTRPWHVRMLSRVGREIRTIALLGLTIWLVVLPLVMARFHLVTPAALIVNPLLMFPVTLAMISGFGLLVFGWLLPPLGAPFGDVCNWNLSLIQSAISYTSSARMGHFWVPGPETWWLTAFYLALAWIALVPHRAPPLLWRWALLTAWCGVGFGAALLAERPAGRLDCTFVYVGHGCGVVIEMPDGRVIVSDAGRLGSPQLGAKELSSYLWSRGLTHIDAIVISHNDTDHFNAVPELLRRFSVGAIYVSPAMFHRDTGAIRHFREAVEQSGVPLRYTWLGDKFAAGDGASVRVLHPPREGMGQTENADSICLEIEYQGRRLLMTGDLASPGLDAVIEEPAAQYDAIMVPHHGSATSNPILFANWAKPHWAVISGDLAHDSRVAVAAYKQAGAIECDCFRQGDRW